LGLFEFGVVIFWEGGGGGLFWFVFIRISVFYQSKFSLYLGKSEKICFSSIISTNFAIFRAEFAKFST
jgi:hypothetical protein